MAGSGKYKVIVLGNSAVGKTALISRLNTGEFRSNTASTIGIDFTVYTVKLDDGSTVDLQIWDTAGQERFRNITRSYYRGAQGIVYVYDVTNPNSFQDLHYWLNSVEETAGRGFDNQGPVAILLGNKIDMADARVVTKSDGETIKDRHSLYGFFEVSAKTGENVDKAFKQIAFFLVDNFGLNQPGESQISTNSQGKSANPFKVEQTVKLNNDAVKDKPSDTSCMKCLP